MAVTQADIDQLQAVRNSGVLTVTFDGPPRRSVTYQDADDIDRALALMRAELARAQGRVPYRTISTSKGL